MSEKKTEMIKAETNQTDGAMSLYNRFADPLEAIDKLGEWLFQSGMFNMRKPAQGRVLALYCMTKGVNPFDVDADFDIIQGRLSPKSGSMLAWFVEAGGQYKIIERSSKRAAVWMKFGDNEATFELTIEEALKEPFVRDSNGKLKPMWSSPRGQMQMLWAKVIRDGVKTLAPGVARGMYTPEEVAEFTSDTEWRPSEDDQVVSEIIHEPQTETETAQVEPVNEPEPEPTSEPAQEADQEEQKQQETDEKQEYDLDKTQVIIDINKYRTLLGVDHNILLNKLKQTYEIEELEDLTVEQAKHVLETLKGVYEKK